jgi:PAS domain S-box-containing protein
MTIGEVARQGSPYLSNDVVTDLPASLADFLRRERVVAFAVYPLLVDEQLVGVLGMFARHRIDTGAFEELSGVLDIIGQYIERKRAEEALRSRERHFRALIEHSHEFISILDASGTLLYANDAHERVLGFSPSTQVGSNAFERMHPDDQAQVADIFARLVRQPGGTALVRFRWQHANGTWRWLESLGTNLLDDPDVRGVVVNSRDATDSVLAEERLRQSEQRFRAMIERSSDMLSLHHEDGRASYVSPSTARLLGYEDAACLLDEHLLDDVHAADRSRLQQQLTSLAGRPGGVIAERYRVRHRDGSWRWTEGSITNLLEDPSVAAYVVHRRDISAEVKALAELEDRVARRTRELELLYEADDALYRSLRVEDVLDALRNAIAAVLRVHVECIAVRQDAVGELHVAPERKNALTADEFRLVSALVQRASIAIENAKLFEVAESNAGLEERQRLARELHDSVSQALFAIALTAAAAGQVAVEEHSVKLPAMLADMHALAQTALAEMRALVFELQPETLARDGVVAALQKQVAAFQARYRVELRTAFCAEPSVPVSVKDVVYRVAQEALHNAGKHARSHAIQLTLTHGLAGLELEVVDDGRGFDSAGSFPGHLGLSSMRERVTRVGGALEIRSSPGAGTHVRARIPVAC